MFLTLVYWSLETRACYVILLDFYVQLFFSEILYPGTQLTTCWFFPLYVYMYVFVYFLEYIFNLIIV